MSLASNPYVHYPARIVQLAPAKQAGATGTTGMQVVRTYLLPGAAPASVLAAVEEYAAGRGPKTVTSALKAFYGPEWRRKLAYGTVPGRAADKHSAVSGGAAEGSGYANDHDLADIESLLASPADKIVRRS